MPYRSSIDWPTCLIEAPTYMPQRRPRLRLVNGNKQLVYIVSRYSDITAKVSYETGNFVWLEGVTSIGYAANQGYEDFAVQKPYKSLSSGNEPSFWNIYSFLRILANQIPTASNHRDDILRLKPMPSHRSKRSYGSCSFHSVTRILGRKCLACAPGTLEKSRTFKPLRSYKHMWVNQISYSSSVLIWIYSFTSL